MKSALLVGAGGMGRAWASNLSSHPDVRIAGWADIRPGAAAAASADMGLTETVSGSDLESMLRQVGPDFVVDVTIPEAHRDVTLMALKAGIPVLGEKPMASSMAQAREMVAASEKSGKLYMVSQSRRYDQNLYAYRCMIQENLGPLGLLNSDFYIGAHFGGFRDEMAHVLILDMAIHTFDTARYICDGDPVSVYCEEFNPPWSWYQGNASATAIFEMSNGLRYTYCGSWCAEGQSTSWNGAWRAVGPKGTAIWDGDHPPSGDAVTGTEGFQRSTEAISVNVPPAPGGIAGSLQDFLHALETGETPMGECHDNIKSLAMVFGAIESAETGKRVKINV